ncbi:MAG: HPF/RaiA family ribosome-associated protein [Gemmatimonas sp.]
MLIQFNTDNHVQAHQELQADLQAALESSLSRFATQITRVEVYLHDMNADRAGEADKRCTLEVRMSGYEPNAVSHDAATVLAAFNGALDKLVRTIDKRLDKLRHPKAHSREQGLNP